MSRHTSYRGITVDMESLMREHEKSTAVGNMKVNARGDIVGKGAVITKTADQIARENHRQPQIIKSGSLKGTVSANDLRSTTSTELEAPASKKKKTKEVELPSGDIVIKDD